MSLFISLLLLSQIWLSGAPSVWLLCLLSVSPSLSTGGVSVPTVGISAYPSSTGPSVGGWSLEMDTWLPVCSWRLRSCLVLGPSCSPSWRASTHTPVPRLCLWCRLSPVPPTAPHWVFLLAVLLQQQAAWLSLSTVSLMTRAVLGRTCGKC